MFLPWTRPPQNLHTIFLQAPYFTWTPYSKSTSNILACTIHHMDPHSKFTSNFLADTILHMDPLLKICTKFSCRHHTSHGHPPQNLHKIFLQTPYITWTPSSKFKSHFLAGTTLHTDKESTNVEHCQLKITLQKGFPLTVR